MTGWPQDPVVVHYVPATGEPLDRRALLDVIAEAGGGGAGLVAFPLERLDPGFFDLRTGVAGELLQLLANYRLRGAFVGALPSGAMDSASFAAFVREANAGRQAWFVDGTAELEARLGAAPDGGTGS